MTPCKQKRLLRENIGVSMNWVRHDKKDNIINRKKMKMKYAPEGTGH